MCSNWEQNSTRRLKYTDTLQSELSDYQIQREKVSTCLQSELSDWRSQEAQAAGMARLLGA